MGPILQGKSVPTTRCRTIDVTPPDVEIPKGSCDCHVHVFGPVRRYPFIDDRAYTPMDALPSDAVIALNRMGIEKVVLTQPSVYGTDNTRLLEAIYELSFQSRGIVVIGPDTNEKILMEMHDKGIRGIRLNGIHWTAEELNGRFSELGSVIEKIADLGWHIEIYVGSQAYPALDTISNQYKIDIALDHSGGVFSANETITHRIEAFKHFESLGNIWVKLSGFYRIRDTDENHGWEKDLLQSITGTMPDRLLWASDWPHTPDHEYGNYPNSEPQPFRKMDAGLLISNFVEWIDDPQIVQRILVDNPNSLYQF